MIKKKQKKVTIMQVKRKIKPFDLLSSKDSSRIMNAYIGLQSTEGWALFVQTIQANIEVLNEQILSKRAINDIKTPILTEVEVDKLRDKREIYLEIINMPNETVQRKMKMDDTEENDDPYYNLGDMPGKRDRP